MEGFFKDLEEHAAKTINYEKKEMIQLTSEKKKLYRKQEVCYIGKKEFNTDDVAVNKNYHKVRIHCHYTRKYRRAAHDICNLRYKTPKEILIVFHNGSTYDYHFIIKELAKEFNGQFECLGENTGKYITFSVPIKKELDSSKAVTYKLKFIDSFRFISSKLSDLINNLSEIYSEECRRCKERKKIKSVCNLIGPKNNKFHYKSNNYKKRWLIPISGFIKKFPNTYKFCNNDINKFCLLIKKGVYPYEYVDSWERFDETLSPDKKAFCRLNYILKTLLMKTIYMLKKYLKNLILKIWVNIMIHMFKVIHYCLQMYLKVL